MKTDPSLFLQKHVLSVLFFIISNILLLCSYLYADSTSIKLEDIVVTASRMDEPVHETTGSTVVIRADEIQNRNTRFVTDILRTLPELNVIQNGGTGMQATIFLRGGDSKHTLVMIDGVKVNSTTTGSFDFSGLTSEDIERIEIIKGPQSTLYGSEAMSGVINIITKKGSKGHKLSGFVEVGSHGRWNPSLTVSGSSKRINYRFTGSYLLNDGISTAKDGSEKDGYKNAKFSGRTELKLGERAALEFSGYHYYDRSELDAFSTSAKKGSDDLNYIQFGHHHMLAAALKTNFIDEWEQKITFSTSRDTFRGRDPDTLFNNYDIITRRNTLDWQHNIFAAEFYTLTLGAEYRKDRGENLDNFMNSIANRAFYLNNKLKLFNDALIVNAGFRYDSHDTAGSKLTYRFGAVYNIKPADLKIKGSYATGFRAPSANELFYPFYGSLDLKPEESRGWEIGLEKELLKKKVNLSVTWFSQKYHNLIQTDPFTWLAANIARAEIKGVEASLRFSLNERTGLRASYAYLDTEDKTTGQRLTRRPKDRASLSLDYKGAKLSGAVDWIVVGSRYDSSVKHNLDAYSIVNLSSSYQLSADASLFVRVQNLFNRFYEEAGSFGTYGLSIYSGIRFRI
ncbi:MAG: TonB-dependent receptor [Nitrospirae bacterium]|nr:TonB-dependent receptor [Nitrospirota bacterium]